MAYKPKLHNFVRHRINNLQAQVYKYYSDNSDYIQVVVLPQPGFSDGNDRFQDWLIDDIKQESITKQ